MKTEAFRDDLASRAFAGLDSPGVNAVSGRRGACWISIDLGRIWSDAWARWCQRQANDLLGIVESDEPGIAAMAAKAVQPTPEPVLSLGGEQGTAAEFAQALQAIRAKSAPPVKETPRGLMTVAAMDHRLGRWNEA
jgi:hypothetical protein